MSQEKKNKTIATITSIISMSLFMLLLFFCGMKRQIPPPQPKNVVLIELDNGGGGGGGNESPANSSHKSSSAPNYTTQSSEDAPSVPNNSHKNPTADVNPVNTTPTPNANASYRPGRGGGSGGGNGTGTGSGDGYGMGPGTGGGSGGGIGYGKGNRTMVHTPQLTINENGNVYVRVHVSKEGYVVDARVISNDQYPTSITNSVILDECVRRAKQAKYASGNEEFRVILFKQ